MSRILTQQEIDVLVEALNSVRGYGDKDQISSDLLRDQVVLSQKEIDALIESLRSPEHSISNPDVHAVLSQDEIDHLIDALNAITNYDTKGGVTGDLFHNQTILSQTEIDHLIDVLKAIRGEW